MIRIEVVNLRIRAAVDATSIWPEPPELNSEKSSPARSRMMLFDRESGLIETPIIQRSMLAEPADGPLAIEEPDTTIIVPPGWTARLDPWGNVRIDHGDRE